MANKTINGSTWATAAHWDTGTIPIDDDVCLIPSTNGADIVCSLQAGVDANAIIVGEGYAFSFGASAAPQQMASDLIVVKGGIGFYFESDANSEGLKVDDCRIQMPSGDTPFELGSTTGDAGDWDAIRVLRGRGTLKANIAFGAACVLRAGYVSDRNGDVNLTIAAGADTLPEYVQLGGRSTFNNVCTVGRIWGTHTQKTAAMTTAYVHPGGVLNYEHASATTIEVFPGGTLNLLTNGAVVKTITTLIEWPGAIILRDKSIHTFTTHTEIP